MKTISLKMIVEKFNGLDAKVRYSSFIFCVLVLVGLDYLLPISAQLRGLAGMDAEVKKISAETLRVKSEVQRMDQIKEGVENARTKLQDVKSKIRSLQEVPALLEDISRIANESQVKIEQLTPLKDAQEPLAAVTDAKYFSLPIVVNARSGYHMFGQFMDQLERSNLLFTVRDLRMSDINAASSLSIQATLKMVLVDKSPEIVK